MTFGRLVLAAVVSLGAAACRQPPPAPTLVTIRVVDEDKQAVPDAEIALGSSIVAKSDLEGTAMVNVAGKEGATFDLEVRCPAQYRSPDGPITIRRQAPSATPPEFLAHCDRLRHKLVIAIKAEGGPNLPVLHLGKEIARTDEAGHAHVLVEGEVHERVELTLSTADPKLAKVHPQNPAASFEIGDHDEIKNFDMKFTRDPKPAARVVKKTGPKQI